MNKTEKLLEFDKIKQIWAEYALTDAAKGQIAEAEPFLEEAKLLANLRETTQSRQLLELCGTPPLVSLQGLAEVLLIAEKGDCLSVEQLILVQNALTAVERLKSYLCRGKAHEISLCFYEENLEPLTDLREMIYLQIVNERVADNASKLLKSLRGDIVAAESKMREKAEAVIRANKECMSDSYSTFRNGHICVPVKKEYKFRITGSVIDKSSTGNTLFVEPTASAKYYEELQGLRLDEENEVRRILYELTCMVDRDAEAIRGNIQMMEKLDYIFSKGKLSMHYAGVEPQITTERCLRLKDARHPLMDRKVCVPLQFELGNGIHGIVITGPNTGGKTVALKTVALNCMLAQCGLHVPCREALICMNSNYLCDIGDGQNLSENLSTFSAHITNVLDILRRVNPQSLVILDELGSGTDPLEGMGIAVAILEELRRSGALFLVTTNYPEIKVYAERAESIVNARMTFDKENLKPLYQMVIGEAGESCAFYIARRLGMPVSMLKRAAEAAYGEDAARMQIGVAEDLGAEEIKLRKEVTPRIRKEKAVNPKKQPRRAYQIGDSVMVYPDKKIGIVCKPENDKGVLQVQMPNKKIWINHKRIKLHVAAQELYPEDYDFSIIFDTVANRKLRHQMERKYVEGEQIEVES
ncbi:MAG: DNA mismatch repair protein MutS [Lachnospiraceae bacterium]|nr:DNA mismatch repair protein MutS [Lachnospiraceae bacterium]